MKKNEKNTEESINYLLVQYQEGINVIKSWLDSRYKILQFIGYFNAAILTFGFSQGVLISKDNRFIGVIICILCILVSVMGLATEFSNSSYLSSYFKTLREVESILGDKLVKENGIFTRGALEMERSTFHKIFPVHRAHKLFYIVLILFWLFLSIYNATF